ncbi:hypothetical protein [Novosphingobium sp. 9]|uniref:hypothetical protein n=1 Tax=Novosphingobium sp. 9 TaxID=2025349 RepID=UPI0021B4DACD|nr:hypothetical protein [Novosphingobium sp. 9]
MGLQTRVRAGWGYWLVAVLALLWNAFGCLDFWMTLTRDPAYMAQMPPDMIDWLNAAPAWIYATWAAGVGGGVLGALLLLARSRWAIGAFAISLVGLAVNQAWQLTGDMPASMHSPGNLAMTATIWVVAVALLWFSVRMRARGVLR